MAKAGLLNLMRSLARERGLEHLDFYHYGFCRLEALDWNNRAVA